MRSALIMTVLLIFLTAPVATAMTTDGKIVITADEIEEIQAHTMADILNTVGGVSAGSSSVSIHGNSKVKVFVDGRPLNDPTSSHGGVKLDLVTPTEVEQIEILRGKGGVRYGQDASGGVILITTRSNKALSGHIKAYAGSHEQGYTNANLQFSSGSWSTSLTGGYDSTDGYKINNDKERKRIGGKLSFNPAGKFSLTLSGDYLEDCRGYSGYPDYPTPHSRKESRMGAYALSANYGDIHSKTYINQGSKKNWDHSRGLNKKVSVDEFGQELNHSYATGDWGQLDYGTAFYWSRAKGSAFPEKKEHTLSAYAVETIPLAHWSLTLGLRTNNNSAFDNAINPEVKVSNKRNGWQTTLAYSRTNNTPNFYKRYNETSSTRPNPDLGMETADNFSLVVNKSLSKQLSVGATLFYNRLSDRITYIRNGGIGQYQNVGRVNYIGGDLSFKWRPIDQLTLKSNYTYLSAKNEESGLYITAKPHHQGRLDLSWQAADPLLIILSLHGKSSAYTTSDNLNQSDGYLLADIRSEYRWGRYALFAEISNLTDKRHLHVDGLLAPPRQWFTGVSANF